MTPTETARKMGVTIASLLNWRRKGIGPRWWREGRRVVYDRGDVEGWVRKLEKRG